MVTKKSEKAMHWSMLVLWLELKRWDIPPSIWLEGLSIIIIRVTIAPKALLALASIVVILRNCPILRSLGLGWHL